MPSVVGLGFWRSERPGRGRAISISFSAQGLSETSVRALLLSSCPYLRVCLELPMPSVVARPHVVSAPRPSRRVLLVIIVQRPAVVRSTASHRACEGVFVLVVSQLALPSVVTGAVALTCVRRADFCDSFVKRMLLILSLPRDIGQRAPVAPHTRGRDETRGGHLTATTIYKEGSFSGRAGEPENARAGEREGEQESGRAEGSPVPSKWWWPRRYPISPPARPRERTRALH